MSASLQTVRRFILLMSTSLTKLLLSCQKNLGCSLKAEDATARQAHRQAGGTCESAVKTYMWITHVAPAGKKFLLMLKRRACPS